MPLRFVVARSLAVLLAFCVATPHVLVARVTPSHGFDMFSAQEEVQAGQQALHPSGPGDRPGGDRLPGRASKTARAGQAGGGEGRPCTSNRSG